MGMILNDGKDRRLDGSGVYRFFSGFGRAGSAHNCYRDSLERETVAPPRCPSPLDSGFRRNDGGYAQHPCAGYDGKNAVVTLSGQFDEMMVQI